MPETSACNFIKKETLAQVFYCEFCEISKNTFFTEHLQATASLLSNYTYIMRDQSSLNLQNTVVKAIDHPLTKD